MTRISDVEIEIAPHSKNGDTFQSHAYQRLTAESREALWCDLRDEFRERDVDQLSRLIESWKKEGSKPRLHTTLLEALYKKAFPIDAKVRLRDGVEQFTTQQDITPLLNRMNRYSLDFFMLHSGEIIGHRGVRGEAPAQLFVQALDDPTREYFTIKTNVVSNYSTLPAVGAYYSEGVVIRRPISMGSLLMAVDHLREGSQPSEGEIHVEGGTFDLDAEYVHFAPNSGVPGGISDQRPLTTTADDMVPVRGLEVTYHRDLLDLLEVAAREDVRVGSESGAHRLLTWYNGVKELGIIPDEEEYDYDLYVQYVSEVNSDAYWTQ